jgi:hypothetical protein
VTLLVLYSPIALIWFVLALEITRCVAEYVAMTN